MRPLHRAHAFSVSLLFVAAAACGSFGAEEGSSPPNPGGSDAGLPDGGAGPSDAGLFEEGGEGPCRAQHDLCHDFHDGSKTGGGWSLALGGANGTAEITPTESLELAASSNGPRLAGALVPASTAFSCSFRIQPITLVETAGLFATIFEARSNDGSRSIELRLLPSGVLDAFAVGPNNGFQKLSVGGSAAKAAWTRIGIVVSPDGAGGGRFEVTVGDVPTTPTNIGSGTVPPDGYASVKIGLGLNKSAASAWKIGIDDLICDRL